MNTFKNIFSTYSSQIISVLSGFGTTVFTAKMLGPSGQGEWALYIQFMQTLVLILGMGLPGSLVYHLASSKISRYVATNIISLLTIFGLIASIITVLLLVYTDNTVVLPDIVKSNSLFYVLLPIHCILLLGLTLNSSLLQAENKFGVNALIVSGGSVGMLLLVLSGYLFVPLNSKALLWIIISHFIILCIQYLVSYFQLTHIDRVYSSAILRWNPSKWSPVIQYSSIAFATNLIQFFSYKMDVWFIHYYHNDKNALGIYTLAVSFSQMIWLLPQAVQNVLFRNYAASSKIISNYRSARGFSIGLFTYGIVGAIVLYSSSYWLIPILFKSSFLPSSPIMNILLLGIVPFCATMSVSAYFASNGRVKINLWSAIIGFLLCLIFDIMWIPSKGIEGAAWASVFSYGLTTLFLILYFIYDYFNLRSVKN